MTMSTPRSEWFERRRQAEQLIPTPVIATCSVRPRRDGRYDVTIQGSNLMTTGIPPVVMVGGQEVREVRIARGQEITGVLDRRPRGRDVSLDLGIARADGIVTELAPAPGIVDRLRWRLQDVLRRGRR
jgi:hypothetical protein